MFPFPYLCVCVCVCVHARERVHVRRCAGVYVEGEEYVSSWNYCKN